MRVTSSQRESSGRSTVSGVGWLTSEFIWRAWLAGSDDT